MSIKDGLTMNWQDSRTKSLALLGVVGGVIVVVLGLIIFTGRSNPPATAAAPDVRMPTTAADGAMSPLYREQIAISDQERAQQARQSGGTSSPTVFMPEPIIEEAPEPAAAAPPRREDSGSRQPQTDQDRQVEVQRRLAFMQELVERRRAAPPSLTHVRGGGQDREDGAREAVAPAPPTSVQGQDPGPDMPVPPAHAVVYAYLTGAIVSTDAGAPVRARLVEAPYAGLTALGAFVQRGDTLLVEFNQLADASGRTVPFRGVAVDPSTQRPTLSDRVDRHYLERFVYLFGSAFVRGLGEAYAMANTVTTTTPAGSVTSRGDVAMRDALIIAGGNVGQVIGETMGRAAAERPPTVYLDQGRPIGILVLESR